MTEKVARLYRVRVRVEFDAGRSWAKWVGPIEAGNRIEAEAKAIEVMQRTFRRALTIEATGGWRRDRREEDRREALAGA